MKYVQRLRELGNDRRLHATDTHLSTDVLISEVDASKLGLTQALRISEVKQNVLKLIRATN